MRSALIRKIGGIVGLLAILMTTLAPAASQMLARTHIEATLAAFCSAEAPHVSRDVRHDHDESALGQLDACGYCNLAAHTPFSASPAHAIRVNVVETTAPSQRQYRFERPCTVLLAAQPRAPPSFA